MRFIASSILELGFLKHGFEVAGLVKLRQNVAPADELPLDVQLRDGRPLPGLALQKQVGRAGRNEA